MADTGTTECCRARGAPLASVFVDLRMSPISNAMRHPNEARDPEPFYPLRTFVSGSCKLLQSAEQLFHESCTFLSPHPKSWLELAKRELLSLLIRLKEESASIAAYGAAAKGNTLLNYCGVRGEFLDYAVDASPHKQGLLIPGTAIPVHAPEHIFETKPQYVLILPWTLKGEIMAQTAGIRAWGRRFIVPLPTPDIIP
jgi:hypothetical protein